MNSLSTERGLKQVGRASWCWEPSALGVGQGRVQAVLQTWEWVPTEPLGPECSPSLGLD